MTNAKLWLLIETIYFYTNKWLLVNRIIIAMNYSDVIEQSGQRTRFN